MTPRRSLPGRPCPAIVPCGQILDLFVSHYGVEAGNVTLRCLTTGGVYPGGGPKIIERLKGPGFLIT